MFIYNSPQLIAVSHVLHRRQVPRHPPYALRSLISKKSFILSLVSLMYPQQNILYSELFVLLFTLHF